VLQGTVQTDDGAPASDVSIDIMQPARGVVFSRQITTGADGTFMLTDLACGEYVVRAGNDLRRVKVKRQTSITLKVSRQAIQAVASAGMRVPKSVSPTRALTPDEVRDEEIAAQFRDSFMASKAKKDERAAYERATTREAKFLIFIMAATAPLAPIYESTPDAPGRAGRAIAGSLNPFRRPPMTLPSAADLLNQRVERADRHGQRMLSLSTKLVRQEHGDETAERFAALDPREKTRTLLAATTSALKKQVWPTTLLLVEAGPQGAADKESIRKELGAESVEYREWGDHLSPRWRGEALLRAQVAFFDNALKFVDAQPTSEQFVAMLSELDHKSSDVLSAMEASRRNDPKLDKLLAAQRERIEQDVAMQLIAETFGKQAWADYRKQDAVGQRQLRDLAQVMRIAEMTALMLSL
jgi:hypothetical protein